VPAAIHVLPYSVLYSGVMKRTRPLVAVLLLLVYTTQALAAAGMSCPRTIHGGDAAGHPREIAASHAGHGMHGHHSPEERDGGARHGACHDCCGSGLCSLTLCHALLALPATPTVLLRPAPDAFEIQLVVAAPVRPATSTFRPPTLA